MILRQLGDSVTLWAIVWLWMLQIWEFKGTNQSLFSGWEDMLWQNRRVQGIEYVKINLTKSPRSESVSPNQACPSRLNGWERRLERRTMKRPGGCLNVGTLSWIREGVDADSGLGGLLTIIRFEGTGLLLPQPPFASEALQPSRNSRGSVLTPQVYCY